mmetsp:Transcript_6753/g.9816  ORF Transcript_6753/g.9816 Transcript_6753/m.9816 type:complete len:230 (+) Transcript_6753:328-1017(+)
MPKTTHTKHAYYYTLICWLTWLFLLCPALVIHTFHCQTPPKRAIPMGKMDLSSIYFLKGQRKSTRLYYMGDENDEEALLASKRNRNRDTRVLTKEFTVADITKEEEKLLRKKHDLKDEEPIMWRVLLHNDQIHSFSYVVQSLVKVVGILSRSQAWEVVVQAHGNDKATVCKAWKAKAEQFCLGLQRQGLTASIVPDYKFAPILTNSGSSESTESRDSINKNTAKHLSNE